MKKLIGLLLIGILFFSFSRQKQKPYSGFNLKEFEKSLCFIPEGRFTPGQGAVEGHPLDYGGFDYSRTSQFSHDYNDTVNSFYMSNTEVSNGQYLEFVNEIKKKDTNSYKLLLPDTTVWRARGVELEPYVDLYFRHPYYSNHPVVGISLAQANQFCIWLTEKYMDQENRKYKNVKFRLPTLEEWAYAASGGNTESVYPWKGLELKDKKGDWLANFKIIYQNDVGRIMLKDNDPDNRDTSIRKEFLVSGFGRASSYELDYSDHFDPSNGPVVRVKSYAPNGFNLYCMAGNVEELVSEEGFSKGGSWNDPGYYIQNFIHQKYDSTNLVSAERGFRFVMEISD